MNNIDDNIWGTLTGLPIKKKKIADVLLPSNGLKILSGNLDSQDAPVFAIEKDIGPDDLLIILKFANK